MPKTKKAQEDTVENKNTRGAILIEQLPESVTLATLEDKVREIIELLNQS